MILNISPSTQLTISLAILAVLAMTYIALRIVCRVFYKDKEEKQEVYKIKKNLN